QPGIHRRILLPPHPRLDDRRRLDRDPQEPHRRGGVRPPLRAAPRQMTAGSTLGQALLRPKSVAIVGASDDPTKPTARPLQHLRRTGFAGAVYPINPKRDSVLGERAWPSIAALPQTPDQVFVLAGTSGVPDAVRDCVSRGVPLVSVLAGGFGEEGEAGRAREVELKAILAGGATRLIGPNSI